MCASALPVSLSEFGVVAWSYTSSVLDSEMREGGVLCVVFFFFSQTFTYISEVIICPINAGERVKILGLCNRL